MPTVPTTTNPERESVRAWLAAQPPLDDPTNIAKPIVEALTNLYNVFEDRASAMEFEYGEGWGYQFEVDQLVTTIDEVCAIVRAFVAGFMVGENRGPATMALVDPLLKAIANTEAISAIRARRWYEQLTDENYDGPREAREHL